MYNTTMLMHSHSIPVIQGLAMSSASTFLVGDVRKAGRVRMIATVLSFGGKSVPIVIGGPPT